MSSMINSWPGSEHMKVWVRETTTPGNRPARSANNFTSTTSEMLPPQWQTYTPMRGVFSLSIGSTSRDHGLANGRAARPVGSTSRRHSLVNHCAAHLSGRVEASQEVGRLHGRRAALHYRVDDILGTGRGARHEHPLPGGQGRPQFGAGEA